MASDRTIKRKDTWTPLKATLTEEGTAINLTGALKVKLIMKSGVTLIEGTCTVTDATNGKVEYVWAAGDTALAGTFETEFEIEWSASKIQTVPNEGHKTITIEPDLGGK